MPIIETTNPASESVAPFPVRRFTVQEYRRLGEIELLGEEDRVELLEGWIVPKMNFNPPHSVAVQLTNDSVRACLPPNWCIRIQDAVTTDDSEPEPDVAVVRGTHRDYTASHPGPRDTGVLIEVAESSLSRDRYKCQIYGRACVPAYWIVNLVDRRIEVFTDPTGPDASPGYRRRDDFGPNDEIPLILDGKTVAKIAVGDLLP